MGAGNAGLKIQMMMDFDFFFLIKRQREREGERDLWLCCVLKGQVKRDLSNKD